MQHDIYTIPLRLNNGTKTTLSEFNGKVLLIVNVASKCGLTKQYEILEKMYEQYRNQGLEILGFPANNFAQQEPGTNEQIEEFCRLTYGVKFPIFEKISVKGADRHELYNVLTQAAPVARGNPDSTLKRKLEEKGFLSNYEDDEILWNFEKFVINKNGRVVARFAPDVEPNDPALIAVIESELKKVGH